MSGPHIVDVIDFSSPSATIDNPQTDPGASWAMGYILSQNIDATLVLVEPTDSLSDVMGLIVQTCRARGRIDLIRFNGHGSPGDLLHGELNEVTAASQRATLSRLRPLFNPGAEAYLLNCWVGLRHQILVHLAEAWHVPVSAGRERQVWGKDISSVRFEGPTLTGHRGGRVERNRPSLPRDPNPHSNFAPAGPVRIPGPPTQAPQRIRPIRIR